MSGESDELPGRSMSRRAPMDHLVRGQRSVPAARRADAQVFVEGRLVGLVAAAGASNDRGTFGLGQGRRDG